MMRRAYAAVLAAALAGCATVPVSGQLVAGEWGGDHVALHLGPAGGTIDYDCAHGTIGPLGIGAGGRFVADGTHTAEHGGPTRVGEVLPSSQVRYEGVVSTGRMTLSGRVESGVLLGPFELRLGEQARLLRCL